MTHLTSTPNSSTPSWLIIIPKVPSEPSRHRVAIWRELRKIGAVPVAAGAWGIPNLPAFTGQLPALRALATKNDGQLSILKVEGLDADDTEPDSDLNVIRTAFTSVREDEWRELAADCQKLSDEIDREIAKEKFTFGELEEEEQSLERLRRWHRDLMRRNVQALPGASIASAALAAVTERLADFSELVFRANLPQDPSEPPPVHRP